MLDLVVAVHTSAWRHAMADDFAVPHRDELEAALLGEGAGARGPYARSTAVLVRENAAPIGRLLARYDALVRTAQAPATAQPERTVLTHGEPHPGNTMLTSRGWLLIDWDTALVAPPERDLWSLDPGDGSVLNAYTDATGVPVRPSMLELYRIRWDLADIAVDVARFHRDHTGSPEDDEVWNVLRATVERVTMIGIGGHDV